MNGNWDLFCAYVSNDLFAVNRVDDCPDFIWIAVDLEELAFHKTVVDNVIQQNIKRGRMEILLAWRIGIRAIRFH